MRAQVHIQLLYIPNRVSIYQKTLKDEYSQLLKYMSAIQFNVCSIFIYIIPFRPVLNNMFQIQHGKRVKRHVIENRTART